MDDDPEEWGARRTIFTILIFLLAIAGLIALVNALGRADGSDGQIFYPQKESAMQENRQLLEGRKHFAKLLHFGPFVRNLGRQHPQSIGLCVCLADFDAKGFKGLRPIGRGWC